MCEKSVVLCSKSSIEWASCSLIRLILNLNCNTFTFDYELIIIKFIEISGVDYNIVKLRYANTLRNSGLLMLVYFISMAFQ